MKLDKDGVLWKFGFWLGYFSPWSYVILAFGLYITLQFFSMEAKDQVVFFGVIFAFVGIIINNNRQKEREHTARMFAEKKVAYESMFSLIHILPTNKANAKMRSEWLKIVPKLMVWSSPETIHKFLALLECDPPANDPNRNVIQYFFVEQLMRQMRLDLGHVDNFPSNEMTIVKMGIISSEHKELDEKLQELIANHANGQS